MHNDTSTTNDAIRTEWDFTLFYASDADPQIEKDMRTIEKACAAFAKKYNTNQITDSNRKQKPYAFLKNEKTLAQALTDYERLYNAIAGSKPLVYWHYKQALDSSNPTMSAQIHTLGERLTKAGNMLTFFDVAIAKVPPARQKLLLASKHLAPWRHMLEQAFLSGAHTLTEAEEKILSLTSQTHSMWVDGVERALNKRVVEVSLRAENEVETLLTLPINEAIPKLATLSNKADRDALWEGISRELTVLHDFCESELNAFYSHKKITDELRGYAHPYSATLLGHEVDEKTMLAVVEAVRSRMDIPRRFFALKKRLLGLEKGVMRLHDTNAPLPTNGVSHELSFPEGYATVRDAYAGIDAEFASIYTSAFQRGQVDVFAKKGKGGGGFHSKTVGAPGVILLNYVPDRRSQFTLAHEMGHFLHSTYSERHQRPLYQGYSTAAAEVASTFGEQVLFHHLLPRVSGEEKRVLLHESVLENITAVFRVIADYTCEDTLYARVYKEGYLPIDEITRTYVESRKQYVGDAVTLFPDDGNRVVYTSHFRLKYYWYSYAFGCLIARALYARVQKDPAYIEKVKQFLSAGGSESPKNIFKKIGIDITKPAFWHEGIDAIEKDLADFEACVA